VGCSLSLWEGAVIALDRALSFVAGLVLAAVAAGFMGLAP
jgi:hypothetical protein